jgi:hypothetical protein
MVEPIKWETWTLIPAGAGWMFAVGIVNQDGRRRVRIAKGKLKVAEAGELPIAQQAKLNLKPSDWPPLRDAVDRYVAQLQNRDPHLQPHPPSRAATPPAPPTPTAPPTPSAPRTPEQLAQDFVQEQAAAYTDLEPD